MAGTASHGMVRGEIRGANERALITALGACRGALESVGGFLVVTEAPAAVRHAVSTWGPPPENAEIMRKLKAAYDPQNTLSPGRFVAGI